MQISDLTFMTDHIWQTLNIPVQEVQQAIGTHRDEHSQYLLIRRWLEQFDDSDLLHRITLAVADNNSRAHSLQLRHIAHQHGLRDSFYETAEEQAKQIRNTGRR